MYNDPVKNFISTGFTILIGNYKHNLDLTGGLFAGLEGKDKSEETAGLSRWLKSPDLSHKDLNSKTPLLPPQHNP